MARLDESDLAPMLAQRLDDDGDGLPDVLAAEQREVFVLREVSGLGFAEIGWIQSCALIVVGMNLH